MENLIFQLLKVLKRGAADQQCSNNPSIEIAGTSHQVVASEQENLASERLTNDIVPHSENELEVDKFDLYQYLLHYSAGKHSIRNYI